MGKLKFHFRRSLWLQVLISTPLAQRGIVVRIYPSDRFWGKWESILPRRPGWEAVGWVVSPIPVSWFCCRLHGRVMLGAIAARSVPANHPWQAGQSAGDLFTKSCRAIPTRTSCSEPFAENTNLSGGDSLGGRDSRDLSWKAREFVARFLGRRSRANRGSGMGIPRTQDSSTQPLQPSSAGVARHRLLGLRECYVLVDRLRNSTRKG
ncbi:hypothetical protein Pan181_40560 [Aeoliella mucimassa]|uniref:Uncharacterized protein n=1 Tax=Aeoliella mucimassa TaxID=2527972 RepID=A0A518ASX3_9BACT|nr:hypothetical protein Pan181_40560 [Aeoliella mucimassa]